MEKKIQSILNISKFGYIIGCTTLYAIAIGIILSAVYAIIQDLYRQTFVVYNLLDEVGLIVFSIAVMDVVKYLTTEEILKHGKERGPREEKQSLTKFVIIIATALALEGLVLTIETAKTNLQGLIYPVSLLFMSALFIVAIGVYHKLSHGTDE